MNRKRLASLLRHRVARDALLRCADQAMYDAKRTGPNRYAFFDAAMNAVAARRHDLQMNLHRAIEADELRLVYQPIRSAALSTM